MNHKFIKREAIKRIDASLSVWWVCPSGVIVHDMSDGYGNVIHQQEEDGGMIMLQPGIKD